MEGHRRPSRVLAVPGPADVPTAAAMDPDAGPGRGSPPAFRATRPRPSVRSVALREGGGGWGKPVEKLTIRRGRRCHCGAGIRQSQGITTRARRPEPTLKDFWLKNADTPMLPMRTCPYWGR